MTQEEGAAPPRELGWWAPLLATLGLLVLPATPPLALVVPVDQTLLLLAPALAVSAVVGWRTGGRLALAVAWTVFALWVLWLPDAATPFTLLARGWGVVLAASFGGVVLFARQPTLLPTALLAVAVALLFVAVAVSLSASGFAGALDVVGAELATRAEVLTATWRDFTAQPQWEELVRENAGAERLAEQVEAQFTSLPRLGRGLAPAMLALESLAALALAWSVYHRFGRARLGPPLAPLRDLRFHDAFVWGIIAGLVTFVLPVPEGWRVLGTNLLVFFGVLYALRGLGVLLWFLAPGRVMLVVWSVLLVLFWSLIGAVALAVGVGDTWLDWRRRPRPKSQRPE